MKNACNENAAHCPSTFIIAENLPTSPESGSKHIALDGHEMWALGSIMGVDIDISFDERTSESLAINAEHDGRHRERQRGWMNGATDGPRKGCRVGQSFDVFNLSLFTSGSDLLAAERTLGRLRLCSSTFAAVFPLLTFSVVAMQQST